MNGRQRALFAGALIAALLAGVRVRALREQKLSRSSLAPKEKNETTDHALAAFGKFRETSSPTRIKLVKANLAKPVAPASLAQPTELEQDRQSIETLSSILSESTQVEASPANLVNQLERAGLLPEASRDADPVTGSMILIQTKNALPGSRYFRAQYFSDEDGNYTPQHISFELRPGTPQKVVDAALAKAFGPLPQPTFKDGEWTSYKNIVPGYTVWTKILNAVDVTENAISAHSKADIGTIQVAIEKALPGHEEEL